MKLPSNNSPEDKDNSSAQQRPLPSVGMFPPKEPEAKPEPKPEPKPEAKPKVKPKTIKEEDLEGEIASRRFRVIQIWQEIAELEEKRQELWDKFTVDRIDARKKHADNWLATIENLEQRLRIRDGK